MKKVYVTYNDGGIIKKGELSEERLSALKNSGTITEVQTYPNKQLMEQTYGNLLCPGGNCNNKNLLIG